MVVGGPLSPILKDVPGLATDAGLPRLVIRIFRGFWRTSITIEVAPALPIPDGAPPGNRPRPLHVGAGPNRGAMEFSQRKSIGSSRTRQQNGGHDYERD